MAERLYAQQGADAGAASASGEEAAGGEAAGGASSEEDVVDAEFEEVKEDRK